MDFLDILADPYFECDYTDHRGEMRHFKLRALRIVFDSASMGYTEKQWLMKATNLDTNESEWFAMKDMQNAVKLNSRKN